MIQTKQPPGNSARFTDAAATAANLQTAVNMVLTGTASTTLTVNATARAATNFFTGSASAGIVPQRVDFDASGDPTGYVAGTTQNTVVWYQGEDSGPDPRSTQSVQVSPSNGIGVGARANEPAIQKMLAGLAKVALAMPKPSSANSNAAYQAIATQAGKLLSAASQSPSVRDIVTQLSIGATQLQNASTSNTAMQNTLQSVLAGFEQALTEEAAIKLMGLQNRLQLKYQLTSTLSKLSLINYIS